MMVASGLDSLGMEKENTFLPPYTPFYPLTHTPAPCLCLEQALLSAWPFRSTLLPPSPCPIEMGLIGGVGGLGTWKEKKKKEEGGGGQTGMGRRRLPWATPCGNPTVCVWQPF